MMEHVTPESVGISSSDIKKYISILENSHLSTHSIIMMRHGKIFYENYYEPFTKDYLHRMYSVSKSFVSIAIGFLNQDGLIDLDKPVSAYLPDDITSYAFDEIKNQTIKDMLTMRTAKTDITDRWFSRKPKDRLRDYFEYTSPQKGGVPKIPGTIFDYDSPGSFVLCAIAERISGKKLMDYLREKLFDKIGVSKKAYCLSCPGGHSWGDSAVMCTARDLARVTQFMLNGGSWEGEQILNREYAFTATSNLVDSDRTGHLLPSGYGYGYLFWRTVGNSFYLNGMGAQYGIAIPDKDMVFVINSDNQGHPNASTIIINRFFEEIADKASDIPLCENENSLMELKEYSSKLKLFAFGGGVKNNVADVINNKVFIMQENPMCISKMSFSFDGDEAKMSYTNKQGDKVLKFGIDKNVFDTFPQEGYSNMIATVYEPGNYYKCAASAKWTHSHSLAILVQVIDKYFGRLHIKIGFTDDNRISVLMNKVAEDFMDEYVGYAEGIAQ